jgi:MYXO-CTERM domain-containing protein
MQWNFLARGLRTAILATGGALLFCSYAGADPITGGTTTVNLDSNTVGALVGLGFSIAPIAPAIADLGAAPPNAVFPITGGDSTTNINHSGGLAFTQGSTTASIQNFIINLAGPDAGKLTGELIAGGSTSENVPFFDIGAGNALTLDPTLAAGLSSLYGIPNLSGAAIGTAIVDATTAATPEPTDTALLGMAMLGAVAFLRRRRATERHTPAGYSA